MRILETREETERNIRVYCLNKLYEEAAKCYRLMAAKQEELGIQMEENRFDMLAPRQQEEWLKVFATISAGWHQEGFADAYMEHTLRMGKNG